MTADVAALGNAIVDVIATADDAFLAAENLAKGAMTLIDERRAKELYGRMAPGIETSGGSAANTVAGLMSFGGSAAFVGKVAADELGDIFAHDIRAMGARYETTRLADGAGTGRCLINVTPDGERTMCTFLGAAQALGPADVTPADIERAKVLYLEGYLFDPHEARRAFAKAAALARTSGSSIALTLSDAFVVERHREALLAFIAAQVDIVFANEAEVAALFETRDFMAAARALSAIAPIAAVTRGEQGSVVLTAAATHEIAAAPVAQVVDTTGAGDQYAAGFLHGLTTERPLELCGRLGSLSAAEVIGHYGPRPAVSLRSLAQAQGL